MPDSTPYRVRHAIEKWYSAHYPLGVRLTYQQRDSLATAIIQRLGLTEDASRA